MQQYLERGYKAVYDFDDIITKDNKMNKIIEYAKKAAYTDCNILLEGASGTGKEVFAQAIHKHSKRPNGPFVAINCAAIPKELIESELFGYEKGAFTGACKDGYAGKFELASGGTLFLDEIGELPLELQSKLLRVLDNRKIVRVGGIYERDLDVRIISATNRTLSSEVNKKNFRNDLYYRLNVISIHLMQLKDRKDDIELFMSYFIDKLNYNNGPKIKKVSDTYIKRIREYNWPGNIREIRNVVERSYYLCDGDTITDEYLPNNILQYKAKEDKADKKVEYAVNKKILNPVIPFEDVERECILNAILYCEGNITKAAELLKIGRATIYRKIQKYNLHEKMTR